MTAPTSVAIGDRVKPASDGEDSRGLLKWSKLRGTVLDVWTEPGTAAEVRAQVRWDRRSPYPSIVPISFLLVA